MIFLWLIVALLAVIVELTTLHFGIIFCAVGALGAVVAVLLGVPPGGQVALFAGLSLASLVLLRRRLIRRLLPAGVPSRTETLLGQAGRVTEPIDPVSGSGRVLVGGEDWAARSTVPLPRGALVTVYAADGIVLQVAPGDPAAASESDPLNP